MGTLHNIMCLYFLCFIGIYPDFCIQSITTNESYKLLTIVNDNNDLNYYNVGGNKSGLIDCTCKYYYFEEALKDLDNNTYVNLTTSFATLLSPVFASNLNNIKIFGHGFPTVDCNHTGSLLCENCNNIVIDNIRWMKCGFYNVSTLAESSISESHQFNNANGLQFLICTNITIQFSTFVESLVEVFQSSGIVNIECVDFLDKDTRFLDNATTNTYAQSYYNGLFIDLHNVAVLEVLINNCLFANKPKSSSIQLLIVKAGLANMLICNTTFVNINGQPTPSIYGNSIVYIDISTKKSSVTFYNVTFQSNNVTDNGNILSVLMNEDDSSILLYSCTFSNNIATRVALLKTRNLTITNSSFKFNNAKSNLISLTSQVSLVSDFNALKFLFNSGGHLLSLNGYSISINFNESMVQNNTLVSGSGLVVLLDYYNLDVLLTGIQFISNSMSAGGSAFYCRSPLITTVNSTETPPTHKLVIQNVKVLRQHGSGHGAGVYISHQSSDSCLVNGSYTS